MLFTEEEERMSQKTLPPKILIRARQIHPMDNKGSMHFTVWKEEHKMTIHPVWFNCGETGEDVRCKCGFTSIERRGNGCWQQGHNKASEHIFDFIHCEMYESAMDEVENIPEYKNLLRHSHSNYPVQPNRWQVPGID